MKYNSTSSALSKGALPVPSQRSAEFLEKLDLTISEVLFDYTLREQYITDYVSWIKSSKRNNVSGLDVFKWRTYTSGTSETFSQFIASNCSKRIRFFKGEFILHKLICRTTNIKWEFIEDAPLDTNDAVIISLPFSDTGRIHTSTSSLLDDCDSLSIPVCVDCAYMVIASGITIDFNRKCIKVITFSLSKGFWGLDKLRVGIRMQRSDTDDLVSVANKWNTINMVSVSVGIQVFKNFSADWLWDTYESKYRDVCSAHKLSTTNCILFGLGGDEFNDYNRGNKLNRVCVSNLLSDLK